jgi:hypothetical protein
LLPTFDRSSGSNGAYESSLESKETVEQNMDCEDKIKEQNDVNAATHLGNEPLIEDSKPAAHPVLNILDNDMDNSFNQVALSMPHHMLSMAEWYA